VSSCFTASLFKPELSIHQSILSSYEIDFYNQNGYVVPKFRLPDDMLKSLQIDLQNLIQANPGVRPEKRVSALPFGLLKGRDVCGLNDFHIGHQQNS